MDLEDSELFREIGETTVAQDRAESALGGRRWRRRLVKAVLALVSAGAIYLAYQLIPDSYGQSLLVKTGAGVGLFLTVAPVLRAARRHRTPVLVVGFILSPTLALFGSLSSGATRSLFEEGAVGSLFIIALDLMIDSWLAAVSRAEASARAKLEEARHRIEGARSCLDYKYAVHDYLGLPRPDKISGLAIADGQTFLNWMASGDWPEQ